MGVKTVIQVVLSVIALAGVASFYFWDSLSGRESLSATLRNIFLIVGTPLAMFLAIWRSKIAQDQVEGWEYDPSMQSGETQSYSYPVFIDRTNTEY